MKKIWWTLLTLVLKMYTAKMADSLKTIWNARSWKAKYEFGDFKNMSSDSLIFFLRTGA